MPMGKNEGMSEIDCNRPSTNETVEPSGTKPLPDVSDLIFMFIVSLLVSTVPNFVLGDGSTGWHLATGHYILEHGSIPQTDLFSSTFPDRHWVPYEWFFDVIAAFLERIGGLKLVAVATSCSIALLFSMVYRECRRDGCHFAIALLLTILGTFASSVHWLARPHIFTFFGLYLFARHLERYRRGEESAKNLLLILTLTMLVWSNAHPAFLVGLAIIVIYIACESVVSFVSGGDFRQQSLSRLKIYALALATTFAVTFINPNGFGLYAYIFAYLQQSKILSVTAEYLPPDFKQLHAVCTALIFFCFVIGLAMNKRPPGLAPVITALAFAWLAVNSTRNEPLFAIVVVPIVGTMFAQMSAERLLNTGFTPAPWVKKLSERVKTVSANMDEVEATCTMHILPTILTIGLVLVCLMGGRIGPLEIVTSKFDPLTKPTGTLDFAKANNLDWKNCFNCDNWGGYIYYKTGNRVFIDDRLDFYGSDFFLDYGKVINMDPDYKKILAKHKIEWVLFPKSVFTENLKKTGDWKTLSEDQASVLLVKTQK